MSAKSTELATAIPTSKVTATAITGAIIVVLVWLVKVIFHIEVPGEVAAAVTTTAGFAVAYMVKAHPRDLITKADVAKAA